jgi:protein-tyrosine-phosphatase/N-acetylglutamate synthase-like GNAT family acetyltransferase
MKRRRVLFVCIENAGRSQMAEAFARMHGGNDFEAESAGSRPSGSINPRAIVAMHERGYDLAPHRSKSIDEIRGPFEAVVTMGCGDGCPMVRAGQRIEWDIPDPKGLDQIGVNAVRDLIEQKVKELLASLRLRSSAAWTLRPAHAGDLGAAQSLLRSCALPAEITANQLAEAYVIAEMEREVVGVAGVEQYGSHGLLRSVAVVPRLRGSGLGAALVAERIAWADSRGIASLFLLTMNADRYFARHGFVPVERAAAPGEIRAGSQFQELCPASAILMKLRSA